MRYRSYRSYYTKLNDNSNNDDTILWDIDHIDPIIPSWMITVIMIIQVYDM